jgi:hypothetical protein
MKDENAFTVQHGIAYQEKDLAQWEKILKPEVYAELFEWVIRNNATAKTGYDVCRGNQFLDFILNYHNRKPKT